MKMLGTLLFLPLHFNPIQTNKDTMQSTPKTKYPFLLLFVSIILCLMPVFRPQHLDEIRDIDVNSVNLVYQIQGKENAEPVILLHGNGGEHDHLSIMIDQLDSAGYLVYALDSRGQGANAPLEEYHYVDMAEDVYALIQELDLDKPTLFGWSDGGNIALQMELLHPGTAGAIITSGANLFPEGLEANLWTEFSKQKEQDSIAPLVKMMLYEPQMTFSDMQTIQCPALIVAGEYDLIDTAHTRAIAENIPQGKVLFLPGEDHGSHVYKSPKMGKVIIEYLKEIKY
jgi:pimeloyl-ACP methyl ester carboxylesterase